jgi:hypothetical protein
MVVMVVAVVTTQLMHRNNAAYHTNPSPNPDQSAVAMSYISGNAIVNIAHIKLHAGREDQHKKVGK